MSFSRPSMALPYQWEYRLSAEYRDDHKQRVREHQQRVSEELPVADAEEEAGKTRTVRRPCEVCRQPFEQPVAGSRRTCSEQCAKESSKRTLRESRQRRQRN